MDVLAIFRFYPKISVPNRLAREPWWTHNQFSDEYLELTRTFLCPTDWLENPGGPTTNFRMRS